MKVRICTKCGKKKPATLEFFHKCDRFKDGLQYQCIECQANYRREWNKKNRKRKAKRHREYRQKRKKQQVDAKGGRCQICGYDKCIAALEFHHPNPKNKRGEPGGMGDANSWKEIEKCILVCSNCHREIHYTDELK